MGSMKIGATITLAAACLIATGSATRAETRYFWKDAEGEHYTRDKPRMVTPYTEVSIPDTVAWRSPPAYTDAGAAGAALPAQDLFKKVAPSVYWVRSDLMGIRGGSSRYGSAIAVSDHEAVTNCHIVAEADARLTLGGSQSGEAAEAELVAVDFDADRCVVKTRSLTLNPVRGIRRYDSLEVGEAVFAVGNPRGLERTLSAGLISGVRSLDDARLIQFTAAISPGSSGGGLFDAHGNLVAITSYSLKGAQGINFAIPAEDFWR
jgi:S1-C subfamily serine protease